MYVYSHIFKCIISFVYLFMFNYTNYICIYICIVSYVYIYIFEHIYSKYVLFHMYICIVSFHHFVLRAPPPRGVESPLRAFANEISCGCSQRLQVTWQAHILQVFAKTPRAPQVII